MRNNNASIYSLNLLNQNRSISLPSILQNNRIVLERSRSIQKQQKKEMKSLKLKKYKKKIEPKQRYKKKTKQQKQQSYIQNTIEETVKISTKFLLSPLEIQGIKPPIKEATGLFTHQNYLYLYGGIGSTQDRSWWKLDICQKKWYCHTEAAQASPSGHRINVSKNTVWVTGGLISLSERSKHRQLNPNYCMYRIQGDKHIKLEVSIHMLKPRTGHTCNIVNNQLIVIGGIGIKRYFVSQIEVVSIISYGRFHANCQQPLELAYHEACMISKNKKIAQCDSIIAFGGITPNEECSNSLYSIILTAINVKWRKVEITGRLPEPRYMHSMVSIDKHLIVAGGRNIDRTIFNNVFVLDLESLIWYEIMISGMKFEPRYGHNATIVGKKMFIFGGIGSKRYMDPITYQFQLEEQYNYLIK